MKQAVEMQIPNILFFSHQKLFSMEPHGQKIIPKSLDAVKQPMYRPEDDLERGAAKEGMLQWGGGCGGDRQGGPEEVGGTGLSSCHERTPGSCGGEAHPLLYSFRATGEGGGPW